MPSPPRGADPVKPRILDRLLAGTFLRLFLLFVLGAPLLFVLGDAVENLERYLDRDLPLADVIWSYAYQYPQFVFWSFPIAALLATVFTIQPMTVHREVMATKAGGISFYRLVAPLFFLGLFFTAAGLVLSEAVPKANQIAAELRQDRDRRAGTTGQFVYVTDAGESLMARGLSQQRGRMEGITLLAEPDGGLAEGPVVHIMAREGYWDPEARHWELRDGYRRELHPDGHEDYVNFDTWIHDALVEGPEEIVETYLDEDEMSRGELGTLAARVERSGGDTGRLLVKREQRLAIPLATLIIILFGAPLATSSKRGGAAIGIGMSLATTILYLMLFRIAGAAGYAGTLSPWLAAWLPNLIFLVAGLVLILRVRT
ncbi:MAG: YjgP/YjgQ family permease [Gemmatimonadales bacterium]|nr:MAG: YjgP/YjgQ family permease [Gemmatimonadales bacterium]